MEYIDTDGTVKQISEEVEKKFAEQNQNWVLAEYLIVGYLLINLYYGGIYLWRMLPR